MVAAGFTANAQDGQTAKGKWLVEGNKVLEHTF